MLKATINEIVYDVTDQWCDISLRTFGELCEVEVPEILKELWLAADDKKKYSEIFDNIERRDHLKNFPVFYGKVINILTNIPDEIIEQIDPTLREELYYAHLHPIYFSTLIDAPVYKIGGEIKTFKPTEQDHFYFDGKKYQLPTAIRVFGNAIPMHKEPIVTFAEASDIMIALHEWGEKGIEAMSIVTATYCREIIEGEPLKYDEDTTLKNAEKFKDLDMENIWRVFFCIMSAIKELPNITQDYFEQEREATRQRNEIAV